MKKTILTIGLFTLVLASTSFAAPTTSTSSIDGNTLGASVDGTGAQDTGRTKKLDFAGDDTSLQSSITKMTNVDGTGAQDTGRTKKLD